MKIHSVIGGKRHKLHVREWGKGDAPSILFIHGWSQNHLCWQQTIRERTCRRVPPCRSSIFVAMACRKPPGQGTLYGAPTWADDIAAIIAQLDLNKPFSSGGLMGDSSFATMFAPMVRMQLQGSTSWAQR